MTRGPCVLIVEDNYLLLELLTSLCERQGIRVVAASSGEAALTTLRSAGADIDWLVTDINLPGLIDGWTVAEAYRQLHPGRPVIYTSTARYGDRASVPGSLFLCKPFKLPDVIELAATMMRADAPMLAAS